MRNFELKLTYKSLYTNNNPLTRMRKIVNELDNDLADFKFCELVTVINDNVFLYE